MRNRLKSILLTVSIFTLIWLINVNAATIKLKDVVNDPTGNLYRTTYDLLIERDDMDYINRADFSKFEDLIFVTLDNVYIENGKVFNFSSDDKINNLFIQNSVVNISTFNLDNVENVNVYHSFNMGNMIDSDKIPFGTGTFLNEEYVIDPQYDARITEIAKSIYNKSNKTTEDIIKKTTLYVIDNMTYDEDWIYEDLNLNDAILNKKMGVCEHYAHLESQILNKLGIFTVNVVGYVDKANPKTSTHAWNVLYVNGKWYSLDVTWLDTESHRENLINNKDDKYYMRLLNDKEFNEDHVMYFTNFNLIPTAYRVSKMSIANPVKVVKTTSTKQNTSAAKPKAAPELENPATGAFVSFFLLLIAYLLARYMLYVSKKKTVFYRI